MAHLDSKGPEGKGAGTGRALGRCKKIENKEWPLGRGMGFRRRSDEDGEGKAMRLKSGKEFENKK